MSKLNFVQEGAIKLPPGFRFEPTDEEIVFQYLTRKIFSLPLPASVVPEIILSKYDPWDLPGDGEQDRYFFSKKEAKYQNGNRTNRKTSSGYWKATGSDKRITSPTRKDIVGMRKTLVFHRGKSPNGSRTHWIMYEYRLVNSESASSCFENCNSTQNNLGSWVLCRIFLRMQITENDEEIVQADKDGQHESVRVVQPSSSSCCSSSSSCGSSAITHEVTSSWLGHEETSGCDGLSPFHYQGGP
ncbi:NAC domain-containing protein 41-like [Actinidia eriantha]|uniref:NAC domain-containing protein 41-like n=1 Tax=Actinidia eriantha TaxID=165200 RepID=UPI002582744B|nr:NAC domain-containing protein 41-like [Actinidia eriantha]